MAAQGLFGTSIQIPQLDTVRLQPTGTPGSTFVAPQRVETGGNTRALVDALGGLNSALMGYAKTKDAILDDPNSRDNQEWIAKRQQMSREELMSEAQSGSPHGVKLREDALNALLGERANADFRPAWATHYSTEFDRANGNVDEEYEVWRKKYAESLPTEVAKGNFYRLTEDYKGRVVAADTEDKIATAKGQINATIVDSWGVQIGDMVAKGEKDPQKIAASVLESSTANSAFYGLSGQEQNATVWALAQKMATEGKPELVQALLDTPRGDQPALSSLPEYATKSFELVRGAKDLREKLAGETDYNSIYDVESRVNLGEFTGEDAEALKDNPLYADASVRARLVLQSEQNRRQIAAHAATAEQKRELRLRSERAEATTTAQASALMGQVGGVSKLKDVEVPNVEGTGTKTVTVQQQISAVTTRMESQWADQEEVLAAQYDGDTVRAKKEMNAVRLAWYEGNNVHNDTWANMFSGLPVAANSDVLMKNPEAIGKFVETAELYRNIKAQNPAYAETLLTPQARTFLDTYEMGVNVGKRTPEDALAFAAGYQAKTDGEKAKTRLSPTTKDQIISGALGEIGAEADGTSYGIVSDKVDALAAMGVTDEAQIKKQITSWVNDSTYVINGVAMVATRDLPQDFPILAEMELERVFKERGEAMGWESAQDLFIQPVSGETAWQVWDKTTGMPAGRVYITPKSMDEQRKVIAEDRKKRQSELIAASDADRAQKQVEFNAYIGEMRAKIDATRKKGGKLGKWAADGWERDLEDYINNSDPDYVRGEKQKADAKLRQDARKRSLMLNMADPFPEDGELPDDVKRELNAAAERYGDKLPYPDVK